MGRKRITMVLKTTRPPLSQGHREKTGSFRAEEFSTQERDVKRLSKELCLVKQREHNVLDVTAQQENHR